MELFGPFDLIPAPSAELLGEAAEWTGTWSEDYKVSSELLTSAANVEKLKHSKLNGGKKWDKSAVSEQLIDEDLVEKKSDDAKREKLTKTLAWLHSRGKPRDLRGE